MSLIYRVILHSKCEYVMTYPSYWTFAPLAGALKLLRFTVGLEVEVMGPRPIIRPVVRGREQAYY
jgi:hypothetical protein